MMIHSQVYARVGLAGNPSDGFYGKTLSACITNWSATVFIKPRAQAGIVIEVDTTMDRLEYQSLRHIADHTERYGHYGALRLIQATCALFWKRYETGPTTGHGFSIKYTSSIPRQVGLGGSSAIVVALLNCLIQHCGLEIEPSERAHLAWSVENEELGITAGLQDRVVQTYGGLVYMDFNMDRMNETGHGKYEPLWYPLPQAFIAYTHHPRKISGQVHNPIHHEFELGNQEVLEAMTKLAKIADGARNCLETKKHKSFGHLMDYNFTTRLALYGEEGVGKDNLKMAKIAGRCDCPAKLPGSGGAVLGLYPDDETYEKLAEDYGKEGYEIVKVVWDQ